LTLWNAGFVAEELAPRLVTTGAGPGAVVGVGSLHVTSDDEESRAAVRRELRRRAGSGSNVLTWVIRTKSGTAVGLLSADTQGRRGAVAVSIARGYRRRGYATEALRALSGWLENRQTVVETRVRVGDRICERLVASTSFVPTGVVVSGQWRVWVRPPPG
jgi:RimJ/RimL family protein N-acetyltransferase